MNKFMLLTILIASSMTGHGMTLPSNSHEVHHVILLIDRSGSMLNKGQEEEDLQLIRNLIENGLRKMCFRENRFLKHRALLDRNKGDYFSIISFGKGSRERNLRGFIQDVPSRTQEKRRYMRNFGSDTFGSLAAHVVDPIRLGNEPSYKFFNRNYSIISLAMPLALHALQRDDGAVVVHRTFIVLVTDGIFNGGDPNQELQVIGRLTSQEKDRAMEIYRSIQSSYAWSPLTDHGPVGDKDLEAGKVKVRVFEFVPIAKVFAIESLIRFNGGELFFERRPGSYLAHFTMTPTNQVPDFHIAEIQARLVDANGALVGTNQHVLTGLSQPETLDFHIDDSLAGSNLSLDLRFLVDWREKNYGIHQLHPDGGALQGAGGLERSIPAAYDETLEIWGWIPISNWLFSLTASFWGDSQQDVQFFWQSVSVVLIILTFILLFIKLLHYLRKRSQITEEAINVEQIDYN
jgi:hypothetical protein